MAALAVALLVLAVLPSSTLGASVSPPGSTEGKPSPGPTAFVPFSMNVRVNSGGTGYNHQVEPTMVINSAGRIFAGWKEAITATGGGQRVAFSYSSDGGMTWAPNRLMPLATLAHQSDPWLSVTAGDRVFFTRVEYADTSTPGGLAVTSTTDGVTWGPTYFYDDAPNFADKESAANDAAGNLYWVWNTDSSTEELAFARSNDGGQTWTPRVLVNDVTGSLGGIVQVAPNGNVLATWWSWVSNNIFFDRSTDGGVTWGTDVRVNDIVGSADSPLNSDPVVLPAMAVASNGTIYAVWPDYRNARPGGVANGNMDIYASHSTDGGATWSPAVRVNDDATIARQWMPDLAIDPSGGVHVAWEDDRTGQHNIYYANSTNGGVTFGPNVRVSQVGTPLTYTRPGDYLAIESAPNGTIDVVWTDGRGTDQDIYFSTLPPSTDYVLDTVPSGLTLQLDSGPVTAPYRFPCAGGSLHTIDALSPQGGGATRYTFGSWSDGGAQTHPITCGATHAYTAFFTTEYQITVTTSPANRDVIVDGTTATAPQTSWWLQGSPHTLAVPSPQTTGTTRYMFSAWSDGGAQTHPILASAPATYTANFETQYEVVVDTSPPNLNVTVDGANAPAPRTFWWAAGSPHTLALASPQVTGGVRYTFSAWSDGGAQNHSVLVSSPRTLTANFGVEYEITLRTVPPGITVAVDGNAYPAPYTFWCDANATRGIDAPTPSLGPRTRVTFLGWSDGGAQTHAISCDAPATYTATFLIEDEIVVDTSPAGLQLVVGGVTATAPYAFYCPRGGSRTLEASSPQGSGGMRYTFASWSDGGARNHTIGCFVPADFTAMFGTEYQVTLATSPPGLQVLLNGTTVTTPQSFWWPMGSGHGLDVVTPQGAGGTRNVFLSWSDSGARAHSVTATEPATLTAAFQVQYQLSVSTPRGAAHCDIVGCWYDAGVTAAFAVDATILSGATGTRYRFTGWAGDSTSSYSPGAILMDGPKAVTAEWQTEYLLTIESPYGTPTGGGWYAVDSTATASVEPTATANGTTHRFTGWTGDATSASASFGVTMDGPKTIRATWESAAEPPTPSNGFGDLLPWIALLAVVLVLVVLFLWRRRRKDEDEPTPPSSPN